MLERILNTIIIILLAAICISSHILVKELEKSIIVYDNIIRECTKDQTTIELEEVDIKEMIRVFEEENENYSYKYYKKLELENYCTCDECRIDWVWGYPPDYEKLVNNMTVAANPETLSLGSYIRIREIKYLVAYISDSIPLDKVYIYMSKHNHLDDLYNGVHDVYLAKK